MQLRTHNSNKKERALHESVDGFTRLKFIRYIFFVVCGLDLLQLATDRWLSVQFHVYTGAHCEHRQTVSPALNCILYVETQNSLANTQNRIYFSLGTDGILVRLFFVHINDLSFVVFREHNLFTSFFDEHLHFAIVSAFVHKSINDLDLFCVFSFSLSLSFVRSVIDSFVFAHNTR